jgi:hypothetical protein
MPRTRPGPASCYWRIQVRQSAGGRYREIERRKSTTEAMTVWSRLASRAKSGETGRRGWARLVDPHGVVREEIDITAAVRAAQGVQP